MPRLQRLTAFTIAALSLLVFTIPEVNADSDTTNSTSRFQIDLIFPRNETYRQSDILPIALAVQNYSAIGTVGRSFTFSWFIQSYRDGRIPGGVAYDLGDFDEDPPLDENGTALLVASTNVTDWIQETSRSHQSEDGLRYNLRWYIRWSFSDACGTLKHQITGEVMFSIATDWEIESGYEGNKSTPYPDVFDVLGCPVQGPIAEVANATRKGSCPIVRNTWKTDEGTQCALPIDKALASRVSSMATGSATAALQGTAVTTAAQPSETNAAPARNLRSAVPLVSGALWICYYLV